MASTNDLSPPSWPLIPLANAPHSTQGPNPDVYCWFSEDMVMIHNVMIRSMNAMAQCAPLVTKADERSFVSYALVSIETIRSHHHTEEAVVFPRLQKKLDMNHNIEQHEAFHAPMDAFWDYFSAVNAKKEVYDGAKALSLIKAFGDPLVTHLTEEIGTLSPEKMAVFTPEEIKETIKVLEDHLKKQGGLLTVGPFVLTGHDKTTAANWPSLPGPLVWFVRNIGFWVHRSYWKFAPFDRRGNPQTYKP